MHRGKTAILVVSYGCSYAGAREKTLDRIEADIRAAYPECLVCHAWTSRILRRKIMGQEEIRIPGVGEALEELRNLGIQDVVIQPTHVLNGLENREMAGEIQMAAGKFRQTVTGAPLLSSDADKKKVIQVIAEEIQPKDTEALALMGHGTSSGADAVYDEMNDMFQQEGCDNIFLGTMEGKTGLEPMLRRILRRNPERIFLAPFMIVAGKHAMDDLNGEKDTSWKNRFRMEGFDVECILKGLGEYEGIRRIFLEHVEDSMEKLR